MDWYWPWRWDYVGLDVECGLTICVVCGLCYGGGAWAFGLHVVLFSVGYF
jgi:hypothetical protein